MYIDPIWYGLIYYALFLYGHALVWTVILLFFVPENKMPAVGILTVVVWLTVAIVYVFIPDFSQWSWWEGR